mmetsp:Transcript_11525/g.32766  ORF Transcript_11525/g.32766 Transcript_11525/m.32766 type:complete len:349 (-) Transcript_11525:1505-2551(-)
MLRCLADAERHTPLPKLPRAGLCKRSCFLEARVRRCALPNWICTCTTKLRFGRQDFCPPAPALSTSTPHREKLVRGLRARPTLAGRERGPNSTCKTRRFPSRDAHDHCAGAAKRDCRWVKLQPTILDVLYEQRAQLLGHLVLEHQERLLQDHHLWIHRQRSRQTDQADLGGRQCLHPSLWAVHDLCLTREVLLHLLQQVVQPQVLKYLVQTLDVLGPWLARQAQGQVLEQRAVQELRISRDVQDAQVGGDEDLALRREDCVREQAEQVGLSRAVRPDHCDDVALGDLEVNRAEELGALGDGVADAGQADGHHVPREALLAGERRRRRPPGAIHGLPCAEIRVAVEHQG